MFILKVHNYYKKELKNLAYIYKITNQINQKIYIGKTEQRNPEKRWKEHIREANKQRSQHRALYRAINKYGIENFEFSIVEETIEPNEREKYYIKLYDSYHNGYNETLGGDGTSYLELPEEDLCKYYLMVKSLKKTAQKFNCNRDTVDKILYKHNISKYSNVEVASEAATSQKKAVAQLDKNTNEILNIYESIAAAEKAVPCNGHITQVCNGKRKTAGGFKWKFV